MNNKAMTGLMTAAAALMGAFSTIVPANAASLKNSDEWNDLTEHPVQDKSTDNSGFQALLPRLKKTGLLNSQGSALDWTYVLSLVLPPLIGAVTGFPPPID